MTLLGIFSGIFSRRADISRIAARGERARSDSARVIESLWRFVTNALERKS